MDVGLTRRNIGRLVLLTWAVALAWLARREFAKTDSAAVTERTRGLEPGAQYFAVYAGGRQIGQLNLSVDTLVDGVRLSELFVLELPAGDSTRQLARGTDYILSRALRLRQLVRTAYGTGPPERLDASLGTDSIFSIVNGEAAAPRSGQSRLRIDPDAILPGMLPYRAAYGGSLRVGESFTFPLIELGLPGTRPLRVRVAAESTFIVPDSAVWDSASARWVPATSDTLQAWRLDHDAPGAPTSSWVDAGGALVGQEIAGGIRLVRSAFEIVSNNYRNARRGENSAWRRQIPGMVALVATEHRPDSSTGVRLFQVGYDSAASLRGTPSFLEGGRQALRGDTLTVRRESPEVAADAALGMAMGPAWDLAVLEDAMRTVARAAVRGAATARDSATALTRWVAREVATDAAVTAPGTALGALRARRGGADGKARLLATLARVSGIPARVVTGVAVIPAGVFSHAWTELWLGRWVAADPSFGHLPASASLIRLALGERSRAIDLLPLMASARFLPIPSGR